MLASARAYETERRRAETLAELDRAKTAFFTNVSHELRTPLTLLLGPAEDALADEDAPLPDASASGSRSIHRNAQRLLKLVNTLLDFSRMESGHGRPRTSSRSTSPRYTAELASMFESAVERAGLELTIDCPPLPEPVYVDREMWAKIVLNLLSNALKFTFEGGIAVRARRRPATSAELTRDRHRHRHRPGTSSRGCSSASTASAAPARAPTRARASGSRWWPSWPRCTAATASVESTPGERQHVRGPAAARRRAPARRPGRRTTARHAVGRPPGRGLPGRGAALARRARRAPATATRDGRPRVLVVDDNADMRDYIAALLGEQLRGRDGARRRGGARAARGPTRPTSC